MLSDKKIKELISSGKLVIDPLREDSIQQNGVDFRMGGEIALLKEEESALDLTDPEVDRSFYVMDLSEKGVVIGPRTSFLVHTEEFISLPVNLAALCGLRSTFARFGFISPPTVVDAGFSGQLTIGIFWAGARPVRIYPGIRFLHVVFFEVSGGVELPYFGHYQGQRGVRLPKPLERDVEHVKEG